MAKGSLRNGNALRSPGTTKYDAHHTVLSKTYGALADLRRELADSKADVANRTDILNQFSLCADSQRAWLLLEDYFEKLSLSRKDFSGDDWWPRLMAVEGKTRLEQMAFLFLRAHRPLPTELMSFANLDHFAEVEEAEQEQQLMQQWEHWLFPPTPAHLDSPRASLRVICQTQPDPDQPVRHRLGVQFHLFRSRTGEKHKTMAEIIELTTRAAHEQELFQPADWEFIQWLADTHSSRLDGEPTMMLSGLELLQWLARWGHGSRLELAGGLGSLKFHGEVAELTPHLENGGSELSFLHQVTLPDGTVHPLSKVQFFSQRPPLALVGNTFYLLRNSPPPALLEHWSKKPAIPVRKLSHRLLKQLRKTRSDNGADWEQLCVAHAAVPQFIFELLDDIVRLRLMARSERDQSLWIWNGHEWQPNEPRKNAQDKPEILDDPRLEPVTNWLRKLDWFTPEPGLWVGDANESFLSTLGAAWMERPDNAEYLGNPAFHRLFLSPRQLRPRVVVKGSGIDWLSVSAEWEQEGLRLT
ncbi:MAG TPA: ATP-dependent helicase, partial [Verrucomicrobiae bacterium]|nr:ATP-dependent helicase [Verrucomicrobiae bacterium]